MIDRKDLGKGNFERSGHAIWIVEPANSTHNRSSSRASSTPTREQLQQRKTFNNQIVLPGDSESQKNVDILTPSEDLTSQSSSFEDNSSELCHRLSFLDFSKSSPPFELRASSWWEPPHNLSPGHVVFGSPSESSVDSSEHNSDCQPIQSIPEHEGNSLNAAAKRVIHENRIQTSVGSASHAEGSCRPCIFILTDLGCKQGLACNFCHLYHNRRGRPRPGKAKRHRHKELIKQAAQSINALEGERDLVDAMASDKMLSEVPSRRQSSALMEL